MFARPATTVNKNPVYGFSAVEKKDWKKSCNMKAGMPIERILPYVMP